MRVLVAGATSVPGLPLLRELVARGHDVVGLTRSSSKSSRGPMRAKDFEPLVAAAQRSGVRRIVAESVIFAYGYPTAGPALMDETDPYPGPPPKGGDEMPAALRRMERNVLSSGEHSDTEGIALRYGCFYGPGVPHDEMFVRLTKWWMMPAMSGSGVVSWVHIDDVASATADALDRGRGGQMYNIVDDRPQSFGGYGWRPRARGG